MSKSQRDKGAAGEREVLELLHKHGWTRAHRNFGSGSQGGGDIARGPAGIGLECKRQETTKIWEWVGQAARDTDGTGDIPVVAFRRNRSEWMACLPFEELLKLLAEREAL